MLSLRRRFSEYKEKDSRNKGKKKKLTKLSKKLLISYYIHRRGLNPDPQLGKMLDPDPRIRNPACSRTPPPGTRPPPPLPGAGTPGSVVHSTGKKIIEFF
jgi:hypothetical protein